MRGEERRGLNDAHIGQEGGRHSCGVYQLPPAPTISVPSHVVPILPFCLGWPPSPPLPLLLHCQLLFLSSSSFLPPIGQKMGTGNSCLAQKPPCSCRLALPRMVVNSPGSIDRQAGSILHSVPAELETSGSYVCLILQFPPPCNRKNRASERTE